MQKQLINSLRKKLKRYPHLDELEDFLNRIDKDELKLIVLFGSLPKGTYTQHSDIDVLCVYDKEFKDLRERFLQSYQCSSGLVQPKTITFSEFKKSLLEGNSFLHHILEEGIILYCKIKNDKLELWIAEGKKNLTNTYLPPV